MFKETSACYRVSNIY